MRYITYSADPYDETIIKQGNKATVFDCIQNAFNTVIKDERNRFHPVLSKDFPTQDPSKASSYRNYLEELRPILKTGRNYHFPVFAIGYNWTRCNADSAREAHKRITEQIIPHVQNKLGWSCDDGVIILTHSMGGLVGRSLVEQFPDLKVQGVIHGVQPCNGAATLYARMWAGWEGGEHWYSSKNNIAGRSLGRTRAELLPILSNSPGAMQLSPNQNYTKGWLRIFEHATNRLIKSLPEKDPYSEIYLQTDHWLRLGSFENMNPEISTPEQFEETGDGFTKVIKLAQKFHQKTNNFYHPNTYLIYGQSEKYSTWGAVNLRIEKVEFYTYTIKDDMGYEIEVTDRRETKGPVPMKVFESAVMSGIPARESGKVDLHYQGETYQVHMEGGVEPGDGTVPYNSANPWKAMHEPWERQHWNNHYKNSQTPQSVQYIFECTDKAYEHSASYDADISQNITYYSIMSIIKNKLT